MVYDFEIYLLSNSFYDNYPLSSYPELMYKNSRPYNCLLIDSHDDYFICVPYRTSINHNNAFHFKKSKRSRNSKSGLDYSKIVIIKDSAYLSSEKAVIDQDEYRETIQNLEQIVSEVLAYVNVYIKHVTGNELIHDSEFNRIYRFSTLKYFRKELGIE